MGGVCPPALLPFALRVAGTSQSNLVPLRDHPATHTHTQMHTHTHGAQQKSSVLALKKKKNVADCYEVFVSLF